MPFKDNNDDIMLWLASRLAWVDGAMPRERLNAERHEIESFCMFSAFKLSEIEVNDADAGRDPYRTSANVPNWISIEIMTYFLVSQYMLGRLGTNFK